MRKSTDICLLCQLNASIKTNSHIYPKFLSTRFLETDNNKRRGYNLDSAKIMDGKPKIIQDSPKEDFILCEDCESFFGILEGISSTTFSNLKDKIENGEYLLQSTQFGLEYVDVSTADKSTIFLLIYSVFWRASISGLDFFENFKLSPNFEEELRVILLNYKQTKKIDYLNFLKGNPNFKVFPTSIITAKSFKNQTENILYAPESIAPYCLVIDQFGFMLFSHSNEIEHKIVQTTSNLTLDDCKIMIFPIELWLSTIVKPPLEILAKKIVSNKND